MLLMGQAAPQLQVSKDILTLFGFSRQALPIR
jgi:hypothetical protein